MKYQLWKSKEVKGLYIIVISELGDIVKVSYETGRMNPKKVHNYQRWYLEQFFSYDSDLTWSYHYVTN